MKSTEYNRGYQECFDAFKDLINRGLNAPPTFMKVKDKDGKTWHLYACDDYSKMMAEKEIKYLLQ